MDSHEVDPLPLERVLSSLKSVRKSHSSSGWTACCPAHDDRHPSLSISVGKEEQVLLHCHAGCSVEQVVEALGLKISDLFPTSPSSLARRQPAHPGISLFDFALDKKLHWRFLINQGILERTNGGLLIQYYYFDGTLAPRHRIRTTLIAKEGSRWTKGPGEVVPYGLERLEQARKVGYLILVEGETDTLTLRLHKYPVLGIPGAEMGKATLKAAYLEGIDRVYIIQEPDPAGKQFVEDIVSLLGDWPWPGSAFIVSLPQAKDPNELYKQDQKGFPTQFQQALDQAKPLFHGSLPINTSKTPSAWTEQDLTEPFTLQRLLEAPMFEAYWTIPGLLSEGLLFLVGKPKQGKSWLALQMALAVASGGIALNSYQVNKSRVLYMALEDTPQRLQIRTKKLLSTSETMPTGLELAVQWPRLDQGGLPKLEAYLETHPQVRLVIIDTWAKLAPHTTSKARSQYAGDYAALAPLKQLADTYHLSILLLHHLRKAAGQDALDEIVGSTGLTGAMDEILLLKREREQDEAQLLLTGRDIPEQSLLLTFDQTTARWTHLHAEHEPDMGGKP